MHPSIKNYIDQTVRKGLSDFGDKKIMQADGTTCTTHLYTQLDLLDKQVNSRHYLNNYLIIFMYFRCIM